MGTGQKIFRYDVKMAKIKKQNGPLFGGRGLLFAAVNGKIMISFFGGRGLGREFLFALL